jgi:hypothetical protein
MLLEQEEDDETVVAMLFVGSPEGSSVSLRRSH